MDKKEQIKADIKDLNKTSKNEYILLPKYVFLVLATCTGLYIALGILVALGIV